MPRGGYSKLDSHFLIHLTSETFSLSTADLIPKWWRWGYWLSPVSYSFNALAVNEMLAPRWMNKLVIILKPFVPNIFSLFLLSTSLLQQENKNNF